MTDRKKKNIPGQEDIFGQNETSDTATGEQADSASFETLLKTPAPVSALAVSPGRLVFAMEGRIYQRGGGGPFRLLFKSGLAPTIDSLAYDALSGVMFFTTRLGLYSLRTGTADLLLEGATGQLRLEGDRLILESMAEKKRFTIEGWRGVLVR